MYLNEKAWEIEQDDPYMVDSAMKDFLRIYSAIKRTYPRKEIYVPENEEIYLRSRKYPIEKWLSSTDKEYRRLFLSFKDKRITYRIEDENDILVNGESLKGGTEAYLNDSFMVSICLNEQWKQYCIQGELYSLSNDKIEKVRINNVFDVHQIDKEPIKAILEQESTINIYSYKELWDRRDEIFSHLSFCPSVEEDLNKLEKTYLEQVIKKLRELDRYCEQNGNCRFDPSLLTKTTVESKATLEKYKKEHTFRDGYGREYEASWHMRFTGIPGRIFFVPEYNENSILVCYIGKKLPNVTYSV